MGDEVERAEVDIVGTDDEHDDDIRAEETAHRCGEGPEPPNEDLLGFRMKFDDGAFFPSPDYSITYLDVILSGSLDAGLYRDISITLQHGCFAGQRAYTPLVALAFYNAPYVYRNGSYLNWTPIVACSTTSTGDQCGNPPPNPAYSNA
jgi:hypothetical protein